MKEKIVETCIKFLQNKIDIEEAMDRICSIIVPDEYFGAQSREVPDAFIRNLIAFVYDLHPDLLLGIDSRKLSIVIPKHMFRTFMYEKHYKRRGDWKIVNKKCGVKVHHPILNSLYQHRSLRETDQKYKRVYQAINTLLTEVL